MGISCYYHDSAACLLLNGEIKSAVQEERFTRIKHDSSFPTKSIEYILRTNNISLNDIDVIVFYEKPFLKFERLIETYVKTAPFGFQSFCASMPIWLREKLFQKKLIFDQLKKIDIKFNNINKVKFCEHHLSHAASAFFPSPFTDSAILTLDGVGEWTTTSLGLGENNKIKLLKEINYPHSIGLLYSAFTYYLGFKVNGGEYKLMGLAPYGEPIYKKKIYDNLIEVKDDGSFHLNMKFFDYSTKLKMTNKNFDNLFNEKPRKPESEITQFHMDIASSIQNVTEEIIIKICRYLKKETSSKYLTLAGGVALNCVANGRIAKEKIFDKLWIQPAAGDAGGALGAALAYWHIKLEKERKVIEKKDSMKSSLLGPKFSNQKIKEKLDKFGAKYHEFNDEKIIDLVSDDLISGKAIGWFQGSMEFGPRALGSRSIIADPRNDETQKNLNLKIKFRESFRPFAPIVLDDYLKDYFDIDEESPYMLIVGKLLESKRLNYAENQNSNGINKLKIRRSDVPAITHVDYSARIQSVKKEDQPKLYSLLKSFYNKTDCPILVNTSFNIRGEPIVNSVNDAFRCFMTTNLDILIVENFYLKKEDQI